MCICCGFSKAIVATTTVRSREDQNPSYQLRVLGKRHLQPSTYNNVVTTHWASISSAIYIYIASTQSSMCILVDMIHYSHAYMHRRGRKTNNFTGYTKCKLQYIDFKCNVAIKQHQGMW